MVDEGVESLWGRTAPTNRLESSEVSRGDRGEECYHLRSIVIDTGQDVNFNQDLQFRECCLGINDCEAVL